MQAPFSTARAVLLIVGVALLFRVGASLVPRVNVDEGWSCYLTANPVDQVLRFEVKDRHPPLCLLALKVVRDRVGLQEVPLRLPGALLAVLAVWLAFLVGREIVGPEAAAGGAALYAVSFLAWEYETWMRNYHMLSAFGLLSTWMFLRLEAGGGWKAAIGYVLSSALLVYSHYFGFLALAAHAFHATWVTLRARHDATTPPFRAWGLLAASWLAIALLFLPWLPFLQEQLIRRAARDLAAGPDPMRSLLLALHLLPMLTGLEHLPSLAGRLGSLPREAFVALDAFWTIALGLLACNGILRLRNCPRSPLLAALLAPIALLLLAVAVKFPELCRPRYYACYVPFVGFVLAMGMPTRGTPRRLAAALAMLVLLVNLALLVSYLHTPYYRSANWHEPARWVQERAANGQAIAFYDNFAAHAFNFYYAGDLVHYDIHDVDRTGFLYAPEYAASGRLPQLRLWPEEFPQPAASTLAHLDRGFLVLWYDYNRGVRQWFATHYGVTDVLQVPNYASDGQAEVYSIARRPPPSPPTPRPGR